VSTASFHPEALPAAPGKSPFLAKGHIYRGMLGDFETTVPGGAARAVALIEDDAAREFFRQSFLPGGWYDILPALPLAVASSRGAGRTLSQMSREGARMAAERDVNGVYRFLLKVASPDRVIRAVLRASGQYFAFGSADCVKHEPGHAVIRKLGAPASLVPWFAPTLEGFIGAVMEFAGARDVRVLTRPPEPDGRLQGLETVTLTFEVRWRAAG
jgi:hypothetical protein